MLAIWRVWEATSVHILMDCWFQQVQSNRFTLPDAPVRVPMRSSGTH